MPGAVARLHRSNELSRLYVGGAWGQLAQSARADRKSGETRTEKCGISRQPRVGDLQARSAQGSVAVDAQGGRAFGRAGCDALRSPWRYLFRHATTRKSPGSVEEGARHRAQGRN